MPKLAQPDTAKPRLLNLRSYESHNERAGHKKIEMFTQGELVIFRRVGLTPVLFGECILGARKVACQFAMRPGPLLDDGHPSPIPPLIG